MITLNIISKRIKRILTGGDYAKDNAWDVREIADTVRDVTHTLMKLRWYETRNEGSTQIPSHYIAVFEPVEVKTRSRAGTTYSYVTLPSNFLELPMEMGIQRVVPLTGDEDQVAMIPVTRGFRDLYGSLSTGYLEHQWGYEVYRGELLFTEKDEEHLKESGIDEVLIEMAVVDPVSVGLNDPYPVPPEMVDDLIRLTLGRYGMAENKVQNAMIENTPNLQD